jgi:aspartate kinase
VSDGNHTDISFTVTKVDMNKATEIVNKLGKLVNAREIISDPNICKVSIVGAGMRSHPGVAAKMFSALSDEKINIMMISTSEIRVSCIIDEKYGELAVRILHKVFNMALVQENN